MVNKDERKIEQFFWDSQALQALGAKNTFNRSNWPKIFPKYLHKPYKIYEGFLGQNIKKDSSVLELCCGMGEFSFLLSKLTDSTVLAFDISPESINVAKKTAEYHSVKNVDFRVGCVENIELSENDFDVICMSGSLSYLNLEILLEKIKKWLNPNGCFIAVDTYGHNPIFNIKRRMNCLLGKTTKQTVLGTPKKETIVKIRNSFFDFKIQYCNIFAFVGPFLRLFIGEKYSAMAIDKMDDIFSSLKEYAFKVVFCAKYPKK